MTTLCAAMPASAIDGRSTADSTTARGYSWRTADGRSITIPPMPGSGQLWKNCGLFDKDEKVVRTFRRMRVETPNNILKGGSSNLACGNKDWGYRHLKIRHQADWEGHAAKTGDPWRDAADFAIYAVLIDPDRATYARRNDTFCLSRVILLVNNRTGRVVGTRTPHVIVGARTKNIVTAFPEDKQC
jgi:hypothetical protein